MSINWLAPPSNGGFPVLHYKLYVNNALLDGSVEATQKYYVLTTLTLGTQYKIQISAVNEVGESEKSEANTILFANVPAPPTSLTLASVVESAQEPQIRATWTAPTDSNGDAVQGYRLYIDDAQGGDFTLVYDGAGFANVYTFLIRKQITCGLVYNVRVTALNIAGESLPTLQQIRVGKPSSVPLYLRMTAVVPQASLTLAWQAPEDNGCLPLVKYVLRKNGVDMPDFIAPNSLSFVDTTLATAGGTIGTVITYALKTVNYAGDSSYSEILTVTVGLVPNAPQNLRITSQKEETSVSLAWDNEVSIANNPQTLAYKVYLDDLSGNAPALVFDTTGKALVNFYTITNLVLGKDYYVYATATNALGESPYSNRLTVHTGIVPSKILNVRLESSTTTSLFIRWDFPESNGGLSLTQYTVYLDVGQTGAVTQTITISDTLQNSVEVDQLATGVKVDVQISASNINGEGESSDMRTYYVATAPAAPAAPTETLITLPDYSKDQAAV